MLCLISKPLCHLTVHGLFQYLSNMVWGLLCFNPTCLKVYQCLFSVEILIQLLQLKFLGVNHLEGANTSIFRSASNPKGGPDSDEIYAFLKFYAAQSAKKPTLLMWLGRSIMLA